MKRWPVLTLVLVLIALAAPLTGALAMTDEQYIDQHMLFDDSLAVGILQSKSDGISFAILPYKIGLQTDTGASVQPLGNSTYVIALEYNAKNCELVLSSDEEPVDTLYYLSSDGTLASAKAKYVRTVDSTDGGCLRVIESMNEAVAGCALLTDSGLCYGIYVGDKSFYTPSHEALASAVAASQATIGSGSNEGTELTPEQSSVLYHMSMSVEPQNMLSSVKESPSAWSESWWIALTAVLVAICGIVGVAVAAGSGKEQSVKLLALQGPLSGRQYAVGASVSIGRDTGICGITFPDGSEGISKLHCRLTRSGGHVYLSDCGSTYGTFDANGRKLGKGERVELRAGDRFYLGADRKNGFTLQ